MRALFKTVMPFLTLYGVILFVLGEYEVAGRWLTVLLVSLNVYLVIFSAKKKDMGLLLLFIFIVFYSIGPIKYYFLGMQIGFADYYESPVTVCETTLCLYLFLLTLFYFVKPKQKETYRIPTHSNELVFLSCMVIAICCIVFGLRGENIFEGGGYGSADNESSSLYEYGIIPILIMLLYSNDKQKLWLTYLLAALFVLKDLMYGGRVGVIVLGFSFILLRVQYVWSQKRILTVLFLGFIIMASWGAYRGVASGQLHLTLADANSSEVFFSSMRMHYMVGANIITPSDRLESFFWFFVGIFLPGYMQPPIANLSLYEQSTYPCGGGGLASSFFYVFLGYIGVVLLGLFVAWCLNQRTSKSDAVRFYVVMVIASTPRWFAYYPRQLFKYCVVSMIVFYIFERAFKTKIISGGGRKD